MVLEVDPQGGGLALLGTTIGVRVSIKYSQVSHVYILCLITAQDITL